MGMSSEYVSVETIRKITSSVEVPATSGVKWVSSPLPGLEWRLLCVTPDTPFLLGVWAKCFAALRL